MDLHNNPNVEVAYDNNGAIYSLDHVQEPWLPQAAAPLHEEAPDPKYIAHKYLLEMAEAYRIPKNILSDTPPEVPGQAAPTEAPFGLRLVEERPRYKSTAILYQQTLLGLPVWDSQINISLDENKKVINSLSRINPDASAPPTPKDDARYMGDINEGDLREALGFRRHEGDITINKQDLYVYRYSTKDRQEIPMEEGDAETQGRHFTPTLVLHEVSDTIQNGRYYVVREVLFTLPWPGYGDLNWRALIEVETGSVLYLRALTAGLTGWVFTKDPVTKIGGQAPKSSGSTIELNLLREKVQLPHTIKTSPLSLTGQYAEIKDFSSPFIPPPTSFTGEFDHSVETDGFAAASAYHHIATLFKLITDLGFSIETLFSNTPFPVPVDHRGFNDESNAQAPGNKTGNGSGGFIFGRSDEKSKVGISADFRIAAHEFGHALLWDSIHWPGFGFAHSPGDALGAIYCDPESKAPDRFDTFPWSFFRRRHDRDVADGWAWDGPIYREPQKDFGFYLREQILSTTLFRMYRALGGDAIMNPARQTWASRYALYLIIGGIASITTQAEMPNQYVSAMMLADNGSITIAGSPSFPGGAARKIIRWAFEKQGLYHSLNRPAPVTTRGPPPLVDVYINDGRDGEYDWISSFDDAPGIWNRHAPDGGTTNQTPAAGTKNYCYVAVKNRGTGIAQQIQVNVYKSTVPTASVWPAHFEDVNCLAVASINPNREQSVTVGPFEWIPTASVAFSKNIILAAVSAVGDLSTIDSHSNLACAAGPMDLDKLIPFDNNLALRTF